MNNTQKGSTVVVLLAIIIVILLGVIGYSYLMPTQPQVSESPEINTTAPVVNTVSELSTYVDKTDTGVSYSIKYPSSWTYYKFSCNADGVAFWPKTIAPNFSQGGVCGMTSFLESAPVILSTMSQTQIQLNNSSYQTIYNQMKASLSF